MSLQTEPRDDGAQNLETRDNAADEDLITFTDDDAGLDPTGDEYSTANDGAEGRRTPRPNDDGASGDATGRTSKFDHDENLTTTGDNLGRVSEPNDNKASATHGPGEHRQLKDKPDSKETSIVSRPSNGQLMTADHKLSFSKSEASNSEASKSGQSHLNSSIFGPDESSRLGASQAVSAFESRQDNNGSATSILDQFISAGTDTPSSTEVNDHSISLADLHHRLRSDLDRCYRMGSRVGFMSLPARLQVYILIQALCGDRDIRMTAREGEAKWLNTDPRNVDIEPEDPNNLSVEFNFWNYTNFDTLAGIQVPQNVTHRHVHKMQRIIKDFSCDMHHREQMMLDLRLVFPWFSAAIEKAWYACLPRQRSVLEQWYRDAQVTAGEQTILIQHSSSIDSDMPRHDLLRCFCTGMLTRAMRDVLTSFEHRYFSDETIEEIASRNEYHLLEMLGRLGQPRNGVPEADPISRQQLQNPLPVINADTIRLGRLMEAFKAATPSELDSNEGLLQWDPEELKIIRGFRDDRDWWRHDCNSNGDEGAEDNQASVELN